MAKEKREKIATIISPTANVAYAWLDKKDTKFDAAGKYTITIALPKDDIPEGRLEFGRKVVPGLDWIKHILALSKANGGSDQIGERGCPVKDGDLKKLEDGSPNEAFAGMYYIAAKSGFKPRVVDTKDQPLPGNMTVFSGDRVKVALEPNAWKSALGEGLNFYVNKVMLIEKAERGSDVDFGVEEGEGFVAANSDAGNVDFGVDEEPASNDRDF